VNDFIGFGSQFPGEYLKAALIASLFGVSVLAAGFRYLNRATKLVSNFLSFAREQPMHRESLELSALVRRVADLRRPDLESSRVELELQLDPELPAIQADPDQLQQVLMNLMNNALQALAEVPRPGRLKISTQRAENAIRIQVEDNGPGVPPGAVPHILSRSSPPGR